MRDRAPDSPRALAEWLTRRRHSLVQRLKRQEREHTGALPAALRSYHRRFIGDFRSTPPRPCSLSEVEQAVAGADLVFSGDYHAHPRPEGTHLRWLRLLGRGGRPLTLALELVSSRHQGDLEALAGGRIGEAEFRRRIHFDREWGFEWLPYGRLLKRALAVGCRLVALDHPERGSGASVRARDLHAGDLLATEAARLPERAILVVAGEMHLASPHLPRATLRACRGHGLRLRTVTVFHGSEGLFFSIGRQRLEGRIGALALGEHRYCLLQDAPWVRLLAHLRWLESQDRETVLAPNETIAIWTARTLAMLAGRRLPPHPHAPEEAPTTGALRAEPIARRAVALVEVWTGEPCGSDGSTRRLWLALARCLVEPPLAEEESASGRASRPAVHRPGVRLYRRLVSGGLAGWELRAALSGRPWGSDAEDAARSRPLARS